MYIVIYHFHIIVCASNATFSLRFDLTRRVYETFSGQDFGHCALKRRAF